MSVPWLRLYTETLSDRKIKLISVELDLPRPIILGVWVSLLMLAGESPDRGKLISSRGKPWPIDFLCDEIGIDNKTFSQIINEFIAFDMVYIDDGGIYIITKWEERQFKSDNSYERVKKFRAKSGGNSDILGNNSNEYTKRNVSRSGKETFQETHQNIDTDTDTDINNGASPLLPQSISEINSSQSKHPAIQTFRQVFERYPQKNVYPDIIATIGDSPDDLAFWKDVLTHWKLCPYSPKNYDGMLNCFVKHELPNTQKGHSNNGHSKHQTTTATPRLAISQETKAAWARFTVGGDLGGAETLPPGFAQPPPDD